MAWTDWSIVQRRPLKRNWSFLLGVRSTRDLQSAAFRDESGWETVKNREKCLAMIGFCRNRHWQDLIPWSVLACIFLLYTVVTKSEPNPLSHSILAAYSVKTVSFSGKMFDRLNLGDLVIFMALAFFTGKDFRLEVYFFLPEFHTNRMYIETFKDRIDCIFSLPWYFKVIYN